MRLPTLRTARKARPQLLSLEARITPSHTLTVDDDHVQLPSAQFTSIQAAVNAAHAGDRILVYAGTYREQVVVPDNKDNILITAVRPGTATITVPTAFTDATKSLLIWDTGNQEFIVPTLRLGGAYRVKLSDDHSITPTMDGTFHFEGRHEATMVDLSFASLDVQGGLEYSYKDRVFVRGGYTDLKQITLGAGVKLPDVATLVDKLKNEAKVI